LEKLFRGSNFVLKFSPSYKKRRLRNILSGIGGLLLLLIIMALAVRLFIFAAANDKKQQEKARSEAQGRSISQQHLVHSAMSNRTLPGYN